LNRDQEERGIFSINILTRTSVSKIQKEKEYVVILTEKKEGKENKIVLYQEVVFGLCRF